MLVATTIVLVGVGALAELVVASMRANQRAKQTTFTTVFAQQKMEQLRGLAWGFDALGLPLSDLTTDTSVVPEGGVGGTGLTPSPEGSLQQNTSGYCDFVDARGQSLGGGTTPPFGAAFIRRWSIEPLPASPNDAIVLQVLVVPVGEPRRVWARAWRSPGEVRIVSVKARKAT